MAGGHVAEFRSDEEVLLEALTLAAFEVSATNATEDVRAVIDRFMAAAVQKVVSRRLNYGAIARARVVVH